MERLVPAVLILVPEKARMDAGKASLSAQCGAFSPSALQVRLTLKAICSSTCLNGGTCQSASCQCRGGYAGDFCQVFCFCLKQNIIWHLKNQKLHLIFYTQWYYPSRSLSVRKNVEMGAGVLDQTGIMTKTKKNAIQWHYWQWSRWSYRCACVYGYTGRYCEIDYRTGPCYRYLLICDWIGSNLIFAGRRQKANVPASFGVWSAQDNFAVLP